MITVTQADGTIIELGKEQEEIVANAVTAIKSGQMLYQYSAPAGCGKSIVLRAIVKELGYSEMDIAPMAYTGAASMVMKNNSFFNAKTCHSWLYQPVVTKKIDPTTGDIYYETHYKWKPLESNIKLILIDEASMVSEEIRRDIERNNIPVVACGDTYQLHPVEGKMAYLDESKEKVDKLTKIMRQSKNSAIVMLSNFIRSGGVPKPGQYGEVAVITQDQITNSALKNAEIIICGYNSTRDLLTDYIRRELLGYKTVLPCNGEKIVCRENNWDFTIEDINMVNGMLGICTNIDGSISQMETISGKPVFRINFTPIMFPEVTFNEVIGDYAYFIGNNWERTNIKRKEHHPKYKRRRFNKFEFGYVITTHMSQGNQYGGGIYFSQRFFDEQTRLDYTGITRFKHSCVYVLPDGGPKDTCIPPIENPINSKKCVMYIYGKPQI